MHADDVVESLPTARLDDEFLSAVRMVCRERSPGLSVVDERGHVVGCISSIDLLRVVLPRYTVGEPALARVFDEGHADRVATAFVHTRVGDVVGEALGRAPLIRRQATVVELAELMVRRRCPLVLVENVDGGTLGVATVDRLLTGLVDAAGGTR